MHYLFYIAGSYAACGLILVGLGIWSAISRRCILNKLRNQYSS